MTARHYFDYLGAAREAGIDDDQLEKIKRLFRADYPIDDMLFELHVLRACMSVKAGRTDLAVFLRESGPDQASAA